MQWADELSVEFLKYIFREIMISGSVLESDRDYLPLFLILAYRKEEINDNPRFETVIQILKEQRTTSVLMLRRFTERESNDFVGSTLGQENIPAPILSLVYNEGEGVPFYMKEILRSLVETEKIIFFEDKPVACRTNGKKSAAVGMDTLLSMPIPEQVKGRIQKRLHKLPSEDLRILTAASVIGREFDFEMLQEIAEINEDELLDILDNLINVQIIQEVSTIGDETFQFFHNKLREVLLDSSSADERAHFHLKVAQYMENLHKTDLDTVLPLLASHYFHAHNFENALKYSEKSSELFEKQYMYDDAIFFYKRSIELISKIEKRDETEKPAEKVIIIDKLGQLYLDLEKFDAALEQLEQMLLFSQNLKDQKMEADALLRIGGIKLMKGDINAGEEYVIKADSLFKNIGDELGEARCKP